MTTIDTNNLNTERRKIASQLDPRSFHTSREYYQAIEDQLWLWECEQWQRVERRQAQMQDSIVHVLVSPIVDSDPQHIVYGSETTIKAIHFSAFCTAYNLDESKMLQVSTGTLKEHKGWTRSSKLSPMIYGSPFRPEKVPMSPGEKRKREMELAADKKRMADINYKTPVSKPPVTFNPDAPIEPSKPVQRSFKSAVLETIKGK